MSTFTDKTLKCIECGQDFTYTVAEQELHQSLGYQNEPKRCTPCREAKRQRKGPAAAGGGGGDRPRGGSGVGLGGAGGAGAGAPAKEGAARSANTSGDLRGVRQGGPAAVQAARGP